METRARPSDNAATMEDLPNLLDRIQALVDERDDGAPERLLERMEHTLTDGYARVLALEGEHLRIARDIATAAAEARRSGADRLAALAERMTVIEGDRQRLRARLTPLRLQTEALASSLSSPRRVHS
jgi:hypothetical protein